MSGDYTAKTNLYDVRRSVYYCPKLGEKKPNKHLMILT